MKTRTTIAILFSALTLLAGSCNAAEVAKEFKLPPGQPAHSGYAEVTLTARLSTGRAIRYHHDIWFDGPDRYRVESETSSTSEMRVYEVHNGAYSYSSLFETKGTNNPQWKAFPSYALGKGTLGTYLQPRVTMKNARILDTTFLHGLPVRHWTGTKHGKSGIAKYDVWVSSDPRFPMVLKWQSRSARSSVDWEITRLDIDSTVPAYVFTPQTHPRPGLLALLAMPYWPQWMVLLWNTFFLACWGVLLRSLMVKGCKGRVVTGVVAALGVLTLISVSPRSGAYWYQLNDLPLQFASTAMIAGFAVYVARRIGWPKDWRFLRGTSWTVLAYIVPTVLFGAFFAFAHQRAAASSLALSAEVPFIPVLLLNLAVYTAGWAFLEEFVFRGYLYGVLTERVGSLLAVNVIQALAFALPHIPRDFNQYGLGYRLPVSFLSMFALGLFFGSLRRRYGSIGAPWLVHVAYNITLLYISHAAEVGMGGSLLTQLGR